MHVLDDDLQAGINRVNRGATRRLAPSAGAPILTKTPLPSGARTKGWYRSTRQLAGACAVAVTNPVDGTVTTLLTGWPCTSPANNY